MQVISRSHEDGGKHAGRSLIRAYRNSLWMTFRLEIHNLRLIGEPPHRLISTNRLGLRLDEIYRELADAQSHDLLPARPLRSCSVRPAVGLGDALTRGEIPSKEKVEDGLPQDLESSIRANGLHYFKIKLSGDWKRDIGRLCELSALLSLETNGAFFVTLDGNENFKSFEAFREFWERADCHPDVSQLWDRIIVVEQPVHRDHALSEESGRAARVAKSTLLDDHRRIRCQHGRLAAGAVTSLCQNEPQKLQRNRERHRQCLSP